MKTILLVASFSFCALFGQAQTVLVQPSGANKGYGSFKEFDIRRNNAMVQIAWQTTREEGNRGFEIEKKVGDAPWMMVAYVPSLAPDGNSSKTLSYLYGDNSLIEENTQYRIKQISINGLAAYSSIQALRPYANKVTVYPNPTPDGTVNVGFGSTSTFRDVQVLDLNGQLIQQWLSLNNTSQQINNLQKGNYVVRVIDRQTGLVSSEKIIVL